MRFVPDTIFNPSHKMEEAKISLDKALSKFPDPETDSGDGKVAYHWSGAFTASDGTVMRASFWDWKQGLEACSRVSIWVSNEKYLQEFKKFIEE